VQRRINIREENNMAGQYENFKASMGQYGSKRINTTDATTPTTGYVFVGIKALSDTTIDTTTGNITNLDGAIIFAGDTLPGIFTSITLTSGDCVAFHGIGV
jgi:hypothetical protein